MSFSCINNEKEKTDKKEIQEKVKLSSDTIQTYIPSNQSWDAKTVIGEAVIWRLEDIEGSNNWTSVEATNVL